MQTGGSNINPYSYYKKKTTFVPVEDGFITSVGNKELSAKHGNIPCTSNITFYNMRTINGMTTVIQYEKNK
jgi:hypothetical protein